MTPPTIDQLNADPFMKALLTLLFPKRDDNKALERLKYTLALYKLCTFT